MNRLGSSIEMLLDASVCIDFLKKAIIYLSSLVTSLDPRRLFSPVGIGGGDEDGPGEIDFWRDERRDPLDGVL